MVHWRMTCDLSRTGSEHRLAVHQDGGLADLLLEIEEELNHLREHDVREAKNIITGSVTDSTQGMASAVIGMKINSTIQSRRNAYIQMILKADWEV